MTGLECKETLFKGEIGTPVALDIKAVSDEGEFEGYASTFGNVDNGGDIVVPGAFTESLATRPAPKVKMLLHHDTRRPCGVWTDMFEDNYGLKVKGRLLLSIQDGKETYELMRAKALDSLSIGYRTITDEIDRAAGVRKILKADLMEVSPVTFPMNDRATISTVKNWRAMSADELRELEATLRDEGLSRTDAATAISGLKNWLQRDAGGPDKEQRDAAASAQVAAAKAVFEGLAERIRA